MTQTAKVLVRNEIAAAKLAVTNEAREEVRNNERRAPLKIKEVKRPLRREETSSMRLKEEAIIARKSTDGNPVALGMAEQQAIILGRI